MRDPIRNPYHVLVLCTGNSARSILAEVLFNHLGGGRIMAHSAGSQPKGQVHPEALRLLAAKGHDISGLRSKSWDEFARPGAPEMDFVVTVCGNAADEVCPVWIGTPVTAHWGIADPAAVTSSPADTALAFATAYGQMHRRIEAFLALPVASLDKLALQTRLDAIGQMTDHTTGVL